MRQICPHCSQSFNLDDSATGTKVSCPLCHQDVVVPAVASAQVFQMAPLESPASAQPLNPLAAPAAPDKKEYTDKAAAPPPEKTTTIPETWGDYSHFRSIGLKSTWCKWLIPICFTILYILSFFKWVGLYPGGYAAYTQNAWQALFADMKVDPVSEKYLQLEASLDERLPNSWWMLPYLILLLVALLLAWSEPLLRGLDRRFPPIIEKIFTFRLAILGVCAGFALFFLLIQSLASFGVERALQNKVNASFHKEREAARTPEDIQKVEMEMASSLGGYHLGRTYYLSLVYIFHFIAMAAIASDMLLTYRHDQPPPRIGVMW